MILASLKNSAPYDSLGPRFAAALNFLRTADVANLPIGRIDVLGPAGDDVHALVQDNAMKPADACRWEGHRKYADIQFVVRGTERMGVGPIESFREEVLYDETRDVAFFLAGEGNGVKSHTIVTVGAGEFALFLPADIHMPLIAGTNNRGDGNLGEIVRKIVMKVRV